MLDVENSILLMLSITMLLTSAGKYILKYSFNQLPYIDNHLYPLFSSPFISLRFNTKHIVSTWRPLSKYFFLSLFVLTPSSNLIIAAVNVSLSDEFDENYQKNTWKDSLSKQNSRNGMMIIKIMIMRIIMRMKNENEDKNEKDSECPRKGSKYYI